MRARKAAAARAGTWAGSIKGMEGVEGMGSSLQEQHACGHAGTRARTSMRVEAVGSKGVHVRMQACKHVSRAVCVGL